MPGSIPGSPTILFENALELQFEIATSKVSQVVRMRESECASSPVKKENALLMRAFSGHADLVDS